MANFDIFKTSKPMGGAVATGLILSLCLTPLSASAMDFESRAEVAAKVVQVNGAAPAQNAVNAVNTSKDWTNTQKNTATRKTAGVYDQVLEYQKSKRPLGNKLKATLSPNKIPGVTKAKRTAAVMSIPALLLVFTFLGALWGLGRSGVYERN